jgi:two-component system, chemotaxis family, response regulator Rcp1
MHTTLATTRTAEILLVEDNEHDVILTREAFKMSKFAINLHHAKDGEECMAFLRKQGKYAAAPSPDIILLDLNMPRAHGRDVLAEISTDERLRCLPVVILTTSADENEILEMYQLRCSSYIIKPVDFHQFVRAIRAFADYWLTVAVVPTAPILGTTIERQSTSCCDPG